MSNSVHSSRHERCQSPSKRTEKEFQRLHTISWCIIKSPYTMYTSLIHHLPDRCPLTKWYTCACVFVPSFCGCGLSTEIFSSCFWLLLCSVSELFFPFALTFFLSIFELWITLWTHTNPKCPLKPLITQTWRSNEKDFFRDCRWNWNFCCGFVAFSASEIKKNEGISTVSLASCEWHHVFLTFNEKIVWMLRPCLTLELVLLYPVPPTSSSAPNLLSFRVRFGLLRLPRSCCWFAQHWMPCPDVFGWLCHWFEQNLCSSV